MSWPHPRMLTLHGACCLPRRGCQPPVLSLRRPWRGRIREPPLLFLLFFFFDWWHFHKVRYLETLTITTRTISEPPTSAPGQVPRAPGQMRAGHISEVWSWKCRPPLPSLLPFSSSLAPPSFPFLLPPQPDPTLTPDPHDPGVSLQEAQPACSATVLRLEGQGRIPGLPEACVCRLRGETEVAGAGAGTMWQDSG